MSINLVARANSRLVTSLLELPGLFKLHEESVDFSSAQADGFCLYIITPQTNNDQHIPATIGQLIEDSNKRSESTGFYYADKDGSSIFSKHQIKSLEAIGKMVEENGGRWLKQLPQSQQEWQTLIDQNFQTDKELAQ